MCVIRLGTENLNTTDVILVTWLLVFHRSCLVADFIYTTNPFCLQHTGLILFWLTICLLNKQAGGWGCRYSGSYSWNNCTHYKPKMTANGSCWHTTVILRQSYGYVLRNSQCYSWHRPVPAWAENTRSSSKHSNLILVFLSKRGPPHMTTISNKRGIFRSRVIV